jgi:DNA-binding response OmpR family regulator
MKKILVVDDDIDILTLVEITLTMNKFEVEAISRWEEVSDRVAHFNPDLILLDISLNGADGRDICKKIKLQEETQHIPIILFSANIEMENDIESCHAQAFIAKPYELSHLLKMVRLYLN